MNTNPFVDLDHIVSVRCAAWTPDDRLKLQEIARRLVGLHEQRMRGENVHADVEITALALRSLGAGTEFRGTDVIIEWIRMATERLANALRTAKC